MIEKDKEPEETTDQIIAAGQTKSTLVGNDGAGLTSEVTTIPPIGDGDNIVASGGSADSEAFNKASVNAKMVAAGGLNLKKAGSA